jgi:tRNA (cmo5U34)-methyltransferase
VLDLGTGTGETARGVLAVHPDAMLVGVDASAEMVAIAAAALPEADVRVGRLEDPLPPGPFDVVSSALAVHHLTDKRELFRRIADALAPDGLFVLADVVVPDDPGDAVTRLEAGVDRPDTLADQLRWLAGAGLTPTVVWRHRDLVVVVADGR